MTNNELQVGEAVYWKRGPDGHGNYFVFRAEIIRVAGEDEWARLNRVYIHSVEDFVGFEDLEEWIGRIFNARTEELTRVPPLIQLAEQAE